MNPTTQAWIIFISAAALSGALVSGLAYFVYKSLDLFKSWVILVNEDSGYATITRCKLKGSNVTLKKPFRSFDLQGAARKISKRGGAFFLDETTGLNVRFPTQAELQALAATDERYAKALILDPELTYKTTRTRVKQRFLEGREEKPHWLAQVAPYALGMVLILALGAGIYFITQAAG